MYLLHPVHVCWYLYIWKTKYCLIIIKCKLSLLLDFKLLTMFKLVHILYVNPEVSLNLTYKFCNSKWIVHWPFFPIFSKVNEWKKKKISFWKYCFLPCVSYGDSCLPLWWCHPNAYCFPITDCQCTVLLLISGAPSQTSFEKKAVILSAEHTYHFAWQCSATCSASYDWFVQSMGLESALTSTILSRSKFLWLWLNS